MIRYNIGQTIVTAEELAADSRKDIDCHYFLKLILRARSNAVVMLTIYHSNENPPQPDDIQKAFAEELRIIGIEIAEWDEK